MENSRNTPNVSFKAGMSEIFLTSSDKMFQSSAV